MSSATNPAPAAQEAPETPFTGIDREALKRIDDEIAARKRAKAEREATTTSTTPAALGRVHKIASGA